MKVLRFLWYKATDGQSLDAFTFGGLVYSLIFVSIGGFAVIAAFMMLGVSIGVLEATLSVMKFLYFAIIGTTIVVVILKKYPAFEAYVFKTIDEFKNFK